MKNFVAHNKRIEQKLSAISQEENKLREKLKLVKDNQLYLEKGYFTFPSYCNGEFTQWGGYSRVERLFEQGGEA